MNIKLFEGEKILYELVPHPLSFMEYHALWLAPLIWGLFLAWIYVKYSIFGNPYVSIALWIAGLAIAGIIASLLLIRWRIFIAYMVIAGIAVLIMWKFDAWNSFKLFIPAYNTIVFIFGAFITEVYRKSHHYIITNYRLITEGGILRRKKRSLRHEKISDLGGEQGLLGKIFGFGNIMPITTSGFGLGEDESFAATGMETKKKFGFFGFAGGGKSVDVPRARSYYELRGVHPYREIMDLLEELIHENSVVPYQRKQIELQRKMVDLLDKKGNKK